MQGHRAQCKIDPLACPLYRYTTGHHGGLSDYPEESLATLALPDDPHEAKVIVKIRRLRDGGPHPLCGKYVTVLARIDVVIRAV